MADFFISYNKADLTWAEWISWQLEEAGYKVIVQAWDFRPGSNFVLEMQKATSEAENTIAIISPDYINSLYTQPEWAVAFAEDPTGKKRKLLPVRVRECKLRGLLSQIIYIDLVNSDEASARNALLTGISERGKPTRSPAFPGEYRSSESKHPVFPGREEGVYRSLTDSDTEYHRLKSFRASAKPSHPEPEIPDLLPYLSDCDVQERELKDALMNFQEKKAGSPFICIIHGDMNNCSEGYIERLKRSLARDLGRDHFIDKRFNWPSDPGTKNGRFRTLLSNMSNTLDVGPITGTDEKTSVVKKYWEEISRPREESIFLVMSTLYTKSWRSNELELMELFTNFWCDCPCLPSRCFLFICLRVIYDKVGELSFLGRCLGQKRKQEKQNESVENSIKHLSFPPGTHGITLTRLSSISSECIRQDKKYIVRRSKVQAFASSIR